MKKVVIVQRIVPHYRIPFFDALSEKLSVKGIELKVVYGQELSGTVPKSVDIKNAWAIRVKNKYFRFKDKEVVWQPVYQFVKDVDLVVVEQANRLVVNYLLLLLRKPFNLKVAFWGHGKNFQNQNETGLRERFKRFVSVNVDWWFGYTAKSVHLVEMLGYDPKKITDVQNSIDTTELRIAKEKLNEQEFEHIKLELGIGNDNDNIAIYCGGMYAEKKIHFLIDACKKIKIKIPEFHIIFIGEGPDSLLVKEFADKNDYVHYLGALTGNDRVPYFCISKLLLMPGLVGLAVLDSFVLGTPMVTTDIPIHSPEFAYLLNGTNGAVTQHQPSQYAKVVSHLLTNSADYVKLLEGCKAASTQYTIENMAENYANGILSALNFDKNIV
jgi:glycosyltransferase involved in cell wall biosynthesis